MLGRKERLQASSGNFEAAFLAELKHHGLTGNRSNLPAWNHQPSSFQRCLKNLLKRNPPTALIIDEAPLYIAAQQFLADHGLSAPRDISMICMQRDPAFDWCRPAIAHFLWDGAPMMRRVLQWAHHVACGKPDHKQCDISTSYVPGGSVGPAKIPANRQSE